MSAVMEHPALVELLERAVASASDRVSWLAARVGGCTATEVAKLANGGAGAERDVLKSKIQGDSFRGNRYTEWGKLREAAIAEDVRARTAIAPNDTLFRSIDNPRHLATPDGVGVDFGDYVVLSEIKTSKHDLDPGFVVGAVRGGVLDVTAVSAEQRRQLYFWSTGYYDQIQWQIYVCGAEGARFTWEQHNDDWSGWDENSRSFEYGPRPVDDVLPYVMIPRDDLRIDELVTIADKFLDAYDVALRDAADGVAPEIDTELDTLGFNYLRFIALEKEATESKKDVWQKMLDRLSGCDALSQEGAVARVTYNPGEDKESEAPDVEAAKLADPELFAEVQALSKRWNEHQAQFKKPVVTPGRPTLRVTEIKTKEVKK